MKKIFLWAGVAALCLAMTACDAKESSGGGSGTSGLSSTASAGDSSSGTENQGISLDSYLVLHRDEFNSMSESLKENHQTLKVYAKGSSLVYSYQYTAQLKKPDAVKAALVKSVEISAGSFQASFYSLKMEVPKAESLIVEYRDKDGELLYTREFRQTD